MGFWSYLHPDSGLYPDEESRKMTLIGGGEGAQPHQFQLLKH